MPELPEVETTVRGLRKKVTGLKIVGFWCDWPGIIRYIPPVKLAREIKNTKIISINRRGKNILVNLANKKTLVIHMKMTGHLMYGEHELVNKKWRAINPGPLRDDPYNQYIHAVFVFNKNHLVFCDARKFGKIALHDTANLHTSKELAKLGPELWETTARQFVKLLRTKNKAKIKPALLNQEILAGVGNIYADEALWVAGIHPLSIINKIPDTKLINLHQALNKITKASLKTGGDSTSDYRNVSGERGMSHNFHRVYQQTGKPCRKLGCHGIITRITVAMRGTHLCPEHQRFFG